MKRTKITTPRHPCKHFVRFVVNSPPRRHWTAVFRRGGLDCGCPAYLAGGGSRIRTHGSAANGTTVFKTAALSHSAIPPEGKEIPDQSEIHFSVPAMNCQDAGRGRSAGWGRKRPAFFRDCRSELIARMSRIRISDIDLKPLPQLEFFSGSFRGPAAAP